MRTTLLFGVYMRKLVVSLSLHLILKDTRNVFWLPLKNLKRGWGRALLGYFCFSVTNLIFRLTTSIHGVRVLFIVHVFCLFLDFLCMCVYLFNETEKVWPKFLYSLNSQKESPTSKSGSRIYKAFLDFQPKKNNNNKKNNLCHVG